MTPAPGRALSTIYFCCVLSCITSCETGRIKNQSAHLFAPDHNLTINDLREDGFVEQDPGWFVRGIDDPTVHYFWDDSMNILYQIIMIQKLSTIAEADSFIRSHGGEPIILDRCSQGRFH
jgi:hypothetical protein